METQSIISKEKKEWQQGKELLQSRIQILQKEIAEVEEKTRQAREVRGDAAKARSAVETDRDTVKSLSDGMGHQLPDLEATVKTLATRMPPSFQERLRPLLDRMPKPGAESKVTVAERLQNVLGLLNEMNKMNSEITVVSEIRPLSDGKPSEVKTVYVGLGQAYFVSAGGEAGVGRPADGGWVWQPANELSKEISSVLEILQNKSGPKFVPLPVTIQ